MLLTKSSRHNDSSIRFCFNSCSKLSVILVIQVFVLDFVFRFPVKPPAIDRKGEEEGRIAIPPERKSEKCPNGMMYVYDLPAMFNQELLDRCGDLDPWNSRCNAISNRGLGPPATGISGVPENLIPAWYWTDMFAGEVMYHSRALQHKCRTTAAESAAAFYIPFYAGLAVGKYLFTNSTATERDLYCEKVLTWIGDQPPWKRSNGSDHFTMLGRMTWDFRRSRDGDWGSSFIHMPAMKNVLRLAVERDPWDPMEVSVPYPTGFHPRSKSEMDQWRSYVRRRRRTRLYTFVGARRQVAGDFRTLLLNNCYNDSNSCRVVDCSGRRCYDGTSEILEAFLSSEFCLQPRGDAFTRRSTFDCMLAGSIPVFFWNRSIDRQYEWFLGKSPASFSVFIDRRGVKNRTTSIRKVLEGYSRDEVKKMRETVISLIPKFVYRNSSISDEDQNEGFADAFDVAIDGVLRRFKNSRNGRRKNQQ
ncbi:xyloglucan galactosyltransferase XLT2-like [Andrographis paniculata]|uniref:xyloglucan galactosyltransferase XLT2-like n=1 Tax=Andrographis paniculata TaxID=175694 RepID=UPI0021E6FCF7|nr:xyloglucan galactosyltransferase XLT2-like [Andrographis paniculata]